MAEKSSELDPYGHHLEMQRKREEWAAEKERKAEEEDRARKQAALEAYLLRRGEEWASATGEQPSLNDLATWRREYMGKIETEYQREQQKKMDKAMENYNFQGG
jgi:5'-deoxynucleotidase YfbR-like HD superfamily hydrolase